MSKLVHMALLVSCATLGACDRTTASQHLERGQAYAASADPRSAIIEFKNALQKDPNLVAARLALGQTELSIGDYPSALKELERALDLGAGPDDVMPPLLEAKLESGRYQEVLGALDGLAPSARIDVIRGRALLMSGDLAQATAEFRKAIAADAHQSAAYVGLAQVALVSNDPDTALTLLAQAVAADPRNRAALLAQGDLLATRGRLDEASAAFSAAAKLPSLDLLGELGIARVLILQDKLDDADKTVDKVLAAAPSYPIANYFKGLIAFQKQDFGGAEKALRVVQQQAPEHAPTMLLLGTVKFHQGQFAEADSQVARFVALQPDNVSARRLLAAIRLGNNNPSGAVDALEPVAASLHDAQSLALLGTAYLRSGAGNKAVGYLQQAVELAPDAANLRTQLAVSMIAGGETKNAISQLETAVQLDDKLTDSDVLLVMLRLKERDFDQAAAAAKALAEHDPKNPVGFNLMGAVALAQQDEAGAKAGFEKALALDPSYSPAAQNLARMALAKGDAAGARAPLNALLARDPVDVAALAMLAQIAASERNWTSAKDYLERARSAHADALAPRIALARLGLGTNDFEMAQTVSAEALGLDPNNFDALVVHAQALLALGNTGLAESDVNKLQGLIGAPGTKARALVAVAGLQRQLGQTDRAKANLDRAVSAEPKSVEALVALLQLDAQAGDASAAQARLATLAALDVDATQLKLLGADVSAATGDFEAAAQTYRPLAKNGNRDAVLKLAAVLERAGKLSEATQVMQQYVSDHADDFGAELVLAGYVLKQGDRSASIKRYQALNAKRADSPVVLNNLAWLYFETNDARAVETARRAYELAPRNPDIADTLGWILVQRDANLDEGVKYLETAVGAKPNDASIQYHVAVAYERLNRHTEARRAVDRSLQNGTFPEQAEAQALRTRL